MYVTFLNKIVAFHRPHHDSWPNLIHRLSTAKMVKIPGSLSFVYACVSNKGFNLTMKLVSVLSILPKSQYSFKIYTFFAKYVIYTGISIILLVGGEVKVLY